MFWTIQSRIWHQSRKSWRISLVLGLHCRCHSRMMANTHPSATACSSRITDGRSRYWKLLRLLIRQMDARLARSLVDSMPLLVSWRTVRRGSIITVWPPGMRAANSPGAVKKLSKYWELILSRMSRMLSSEMKGLPLTRRLPKSRSCLQGVRDLGRRNTAECCAPIALTGPRHRPT